MSSKSTVQWIDPLASEANRPVPHLITDSSVVGITMPKVTESWHRPVRTAGSRVSSSLRNKLGKGDTNAAHLTLKVCTLYCNSANNVHACHNMHRHWSRAWEKATPQWPQQADGDTLKQVLEDENVTWNVNSLELEKVINTELFYQSLWNKV